LKIWIARFIYPRFLNKNAAGRSGLPDEINPVRDDAICPFPAIQKPVRELFFRKHKLRAGINIMRP